MINSINLLEAQINDVAEIEGTSMVLSLWMFKVVSFSFHIDVNLFFVTASSHSSPFHISLNHKNIMPIPLC